MKGLRSLLIIKFVFLVVIVSFFTTGQGLVYGEKTGTPVLAQVEVEGMLTDLGLPVYAHLQDAAGEDYALVIASQAQLDRAGVRYSILDENARGADYFILTRLSRDKQVPAELLARHNVLLDDGEQVIIRSTFEQAKTLVGPGFEIRLLDRTPMVLAAAPGQFEASISALTYDAVIAQMINQVTQTTVETYVNNLSGENPVNIGGSSYTIATRHTVSGTPIEKATQYVYEFMEGLGLTVSYHNWSDSGYSGRNVIGEMTGTTQPDEIVLITAHLDDMPSGSIAPGADDNASGSVGVMVSAEELSQQVFHRTVRFIFFTGEEQYLLGSDVYAEMVYQAGDNIVALYNMDMLGTDNVGEPYLRLHTRITSNPGYPGDLAIANTFVDVVNTYSLDNDLSPIIDPDGITQSDHSPFWSRGYSAILGIEDNDNDMSPYYHTTSDTVSTLNMTYFTNFVKASIGTAAHLALRDDVTLIADFTASPTYGAVPLTVNFTDLSVGATSWSWDFGDTGTSTDKDPTYTYTSSGTYTVSLTVTGAPGSDTETKVDYITVTPPQPPVAEFIASSTSIYEGDSVTFTDQSANHPTSWSWTFEGGTPATSTEQNPTVTYNTVGTFDVTLIATNALGSDTETKTNYIEVNEVIPTVGNTVVFGTTSVTPNRRAMPFTMPEDGTIFSVTMYHEAGSGSMMLGVYDGATLPENRLGVTPSTAVNGTADWQTINLTTPVFVQGGTTIWLAWVYESIPGVRYEVGTPGRAQSPDLWAAGMPDPFGTSTQADYVYSIYATYTTTGQAPVADFTASATVITEGDSVTFTDLSANNPDAWDWVFDGGTPGTSTQQNPTITYNTAGTYTVTLTATNAYGSDTETKTDYITVQPAGQPPTADFTYTTSDLTVNFTDTSTDPDGTIVSWDWDFGDGNNSTEQNPSNTYAAGGTYTVTLTVTDNDALTDSTSKDVTVTEPGLEIYVYDITQTIKKQGKNYSSTAVVTIWDTNNAPVADVTVYITWSGVVSGSDSGVTGADGTVTFKSDKVKSTGPFIITVDNVTHATHTYNPALNNETSDSATY
ncbi:MAG: PKD domain-containing protein [Candidatus Aminicenantes bacterium]|nr:PKD domain-containing protein [Candidatus Aminicenantes bacterium]NIQ65184.1 PKD domain-containing protein [Candidatus Aminicenantes bacterium]NIT21187.1 PKD domain-containing protein [Candidatus Aminicenantes bacterium]